MLAKLHSLSQQVRWFPRALMIFFLFLEAGNVVAFENSVAVTTSVESYPHILQKETKKQLSYNTLETHSGNLGICIVLRAWGGKTIYGNWIMGFSF